MNRFLTRLATFSLTGTIFLTALMFLYVYFDPFKVLRAYNSYSYPFVITNRDYISTTMFIKNHKKYGYNSFIFGSSRTLAFRPESWQKYLSDKDSPFMFDASAESIYGIFSKIKYLNSKNTPLQNVLIILCIDASFSNSENHKGHLFIKHPAISGQSMLAFQSEFLKAYMSPKFMINYYCYKITGKYYPFMAGYIENRKVTMDTITNKITIINQEKELSENQTKYYLDRKEVFYKRTGEHADSAQIINTKHLIMLQEIKRILEKNKTNYKVIISPLYDQRKFSNSDISILKNIFGMNLFDFSGKNKFTDPQMNYFETSHYRPVVGDSILKIIYQ